MRPLVQLREDLKFSQELLDAVDILRTGALSRFQSLSRRRQHFEECKIHLADFMTLIDVDAQQHVLLSGNAGGRNKAIMMVTSDEGFLGGLNAQVMQAGLDQASVADELVVIGERGARYLAEDKKTAYLFWPTPEDENIVDRARALRDFFVERMKRRQYQSVWVVYPRFVSLGMQMPEMVKLLPYTEMFGAREKRVGRMGQKRFDPLVEPSMSAVIESLVRMHLAQRLADILWESKLSEEAARVTHLESSREDVQQTRQQQWQEYFKRFHEKSDKSIREIFSGQVRWKHRASG